MCRVLVTAAEATHRRRPHRGKRDQLGEAHRRPRQGGAHRQVNGTQAVGMSPALAEPKLSPEGTETVCTLNGRVLVFSLPLTLANLIIVRLYFCKKKKKKICGSGS